MDRCMSGVFWKLLFSASLRYSYTIVNSSAFLYYYVSRRGSQEPEILEPLYESVAGFAWRRVV
jgi:hypothetical protein